MKIKTIYFYFFVVLVFFFTTSITTENKKALVLEQVSRTPKAVRAVILRARAETKKNKKIFIWVSENSLETEMHLHKDMHFNRDLFTFTGWKIKPRLSEINAYMYEDKDKLVAFLGPQSSISPNVPAHELGHMASALIGHVSNNDEWMEICHNVWQEKTLHPYFVPRGHTAGRGLSAEQQAAEELFAECVAYMAENRLKDFLGGTYADLVKGFVMNIDKL